jgi:hypothetical protein
MARSCCLLSSIGTGVASQSVTGDLGADGTRMSVVDHSCPSPSVSGPALQRYHPAGEVDIGNRSQDHCGFRSEWSQASDPVEHSMTGLGRAGRPALQGTAGMLGLDGPVSAGSVTLG